MSLRFVSPGALSCACDAVFGRGILGFAILVPVAIYLGLSDHNRLGAAICALGGVSAGIAIGAQLVRGHVGRLRLPAGAARMARAARIR